MPTMTAYRWQLSIDPVPSTRSDAGPWPRDARRAMAGDRRRRGNHPLEEIVT